MPIPYGPWSVWVEVRAVVVSPHDSKVVFAGSQIGLSKSTNAGQTFEFVRSPFDNRQIWSIAVHPSSPDSIFVGIAPFDSEYPLWHTEDGGKVWETTGLRIDPFNKLNGAIHATGIAFHPRDPNIIFCSIEIGGIFRSTDGGRNWRRLGPLGNNALDWDIHSLTVTPKGTLYATSPLGVYRSVDDGESFLFHRFEVFAKVDPIAIRDSVTGYARGVTFNPAQPETIYVGIGDLTPGTAGAIMISHDDGRTWTQAPLPVEPNSHIYHIVCHPADPDRVVAASMYGYLYWSVDRGRTWTKQKREFGEIRGLACLPS
jgi:photosystem II stability/assembly factor-like uncharacterized protein